MEWYFNEVCDDVAVLKENDGTYYVVYFKRYAWKHYRCRKYQFDASGDASVSEIEVGDDFLMGLKSTERKDIERVLSAVNNEGGLNPYPADINTHCVGFKVPYVIKHSRETGEPVIVYITATDSEYYYGAAALDNGTHFGLKSVPPFSDDIKRGSGGKGLAASLEERFRHYILVCKDRGCRKVKALSDSIPGFGYLHFAGEKY